ncbi:MAG: Zn-ribbon domain-containing OB-fold protein [bacterium]
MIAPKIRRAMPQRYKYEANKCKKCGKIFFPPRQVCSGCKSENFDSITLNREGKILTYTIIRVPPSQFKDEAPYAVGIVELQGGGRVTTQIADCDFDKLSIGMDVRMEFRRIQEEGEAGVIAYGYKCVPV